MTNGFLRLRERREAVTWPNASPLGFPVIAKLPSVLVTATFCRRVVSWRGVPFGHNRTRPLHIWDGGALLGLPHQAGQFPSSPGSSSRSSGPSTRAKCQFPSSSHVPGVSPGWYPFPTPARAKHPHKVPVSQLLAHPGASPGWCPFPATARAKHPHEVPVSQLLPRPRSLLQVVPVSGGE